MSLYSKFTAWLSGWPEPRAKKIREEDFLFLEEEKIVWERLAIDKGIHKSKLKKLT